MGYEVLLDNNRLQQDEYRDCLTRMTSDVSYVCDFVSGLFTVVSELLNGEYIFVNIEPSHLLEWELLDKLVELSDKFANVNRKLVVEITERVNSESVIDNLPSAIALLKSKGVLVALDDFEGVKDRRYPLLLSCNMDFVKVEYDSNQGLGARGLYSDLSHTNVIIERIEKKQQIAELSNEVWGVQGFLFCNGESITMSKPLSS